MTKKQKMYMAFLESLKTPKTEALIESVQRAFVLTECGANGCVNGYCDTETEADHLGPIGEHDDGYDPQLPDGFNPEDDGDPYAALGSNDEFKLDKLSDEDEYGTEEEDYSAFSPDPEEDEEFASSRGEELLTEDQDEYLNSLVDDVLKKNGF